MEALLQWAYSEGACKARQKRLVPGPQVPKQLMHGSSQTLSRLKLMPIVCSCESKNDWRS